MPRRFFIDGVNSKLSASVMGKQACPRLSACALFIDKVDSKLESCIAERFMAELLATTADKYSGQLTDANACKISAIFAKFTDEVTLQVEQADFRALGCALYMQEAV